MRLLCIALSLLVSSAAFAQRPVRRIVREAVSEFERGNYEEARALFLEAYEVEPSGRVLRGAGMASFEARAYLPAYRQLTRAMEEIENPLTDSQREEVQELLTRVETFLGRFQIVVVPEDAEITIDLRAPERESDGAVLLDLGEHQISVSADGYRALDRTLTVAGGESETLTLELESNAPPPVQRPAEKSIDGLGWGLILGGSAVLAGAITTLAWWINRIGEVDECEQANASGGLCLNLAELESQRRGAATTTMILTLTGAFALTAGIVRWSRSDDRPIVACGAGPTGAGCSARLQF